MSLSHRDFDAVQRTILELYAHRDAEAFRQAVPGILLKIIPAEYFLILDCNVDMRARTVKVTNYLESDARMNGDVIARMERFGFDHPFTEYSMATADPTALKFSDFFTMRQFLDTPLYNEFYRHAGITRVLGIAAPWPSGITTLNSVRCKSERDFTERDRLVMNLLRPHFSQARRNAELRTAAQAARGRSLEAYDLTPREAEVARWLAMGKTNPEIAVILAMSPRTVEKHVEKILKKLEVENRTTAAVILAGSDER